jgi:ubiquinone/menaquinone biosynthesis C-methylase UbiE
LQTTKCVFGKTKINLKDFYFFASNLLTIVYFAKQEVKMTKEREEKLARSLTAETTELLPFLPYLLQDLWELGSSPQDMIQLIKKYLPIAEDTKILDLACGKGAVSVNAAKSLNVNIYGFDLIPDFIEYAKQKAHEWNVETLCHFTCADANEVLRTAKNYDCVILGAAGNILGSPQETLHKLYKTIKPNGYIIIDEAYLISDLSNTDIKYKNYEYLTHEQWMRVFKDSSLTLVEEVSSNEDFDSDVDFIAVRANELIAKHPEKRVMFEGYIKSQHNECADLKNSVRGVTWILQKI